MLHNESLTELNSPTQDQDVTILVVDDNPANLEVLYSALTEVGYEVRVEIDGEHAIQQIESQPPDLILLDVMLPGIDGFEVCRQLKANPLTEKIPIIFMTALVDTNDKVKGLSLGAVDYITKPFQQEEVLARVRTHLKIQNLTKTLEIRNQQLKQEIQERQETEIALENLVAGTSSVTGEDFFPALVKYLAAALKVNYVVISQLKGEQLETLAFWSVDQLGSSFSYSPQFTPCEIVLKKGVYFCGTQVQEQFPDDKDLQVMEVDSYLGIALKDSQQKPIGTLCVLDQQTMSKALRIEKIMRIFAARASAELERIKATQALEEFNKQLEVLVAKRSADLLENQKYLRQITENIENVFWMTNLEKNEIIYVSPAYQKIWGFAPEQLYQSPRQWIEAIHPEDRSRVIAALPQQIEGTYNQEYRIIRADGQVRWIRDRAFPIQNQSGQIYRIAGIAEDITQQKNTEETLKLQERAITASNNGIVIVDNRQTDSPTIFVNPAFEKITGYTKKEVIGKNCRFLQGKDLDQPGLRELREALKKGHSCKVNLRNYRKDGSLFWNELSISPIYDEQGKLTHYIGIQTDISERMLIEEALKRQSTAIEAAIDGIAILDEDHQYIYLNKSHLEMFGYQEQKELIGKSWSDLYDGDQLERFKQEVFPLLREKGHWQGEAFAKRYDGSTFAEEVSLTVIEGGGLVCVCRDITERKQAEKNLKSSLQEKEILLKEIHHRVKNNLLVVSSLLDWQTDYLKDPTVVKIFQESQQRIYSMALIHEKLYQSKNLAKINFGEYLETLVKQLFFSFNLEDDQIEIIFQLKPILLNIETATPCGLIVSELIANIFEHAFPDHRQGKVYLGLSQDQGQIILTIQDNGVGFPPNFNFEQTETLGLQLVKLLTKQIKGKLRIIDNKGMTFKLIFSERKYRKRL